MAQGLLQVALDELAKYSRSREPGELRITRLACELGLFSCVEEETLKGCFELLAEDTAAAGAELVFSRKPLPCVCRDCGHNFELAQKKFFCPECGRDNFRFSGGSGIALTQIQVKEAPKEN